MAHQSFARIKARSGGFAGGQSDELGLKFYRVVHDVMGVELERVAACWRKDYGGIERAFVVSDGVAGEVNCGEAFGWLWP